MTFNPEQLDALSAPLLRANVAERTQAGRKLSYIEGWHAEAEANRIFGYDRWDTETVYERCVAENPRKIGQAGVDGWAVSYVCKVRVTVTTPGGDKVVREGVGAGHGIDRDLGLAHESAVKESATDAEKRALKTFGNPFGLALYDKTQANVANARPPAPQIAGIQTGRQLLEQQQADDRPEYDPEPPLGSNRLSAFEANRQGVGEAIKKFIDGASAKELDLWEKNFDRNTGHVPAGWLPSIRDRIELRREELAGEANIAEDAAEMDAAFQATVGTSGSGSVAGSRAPHTAAQ